MKILFIQNINSEEGGGGAELLCQDILKSLEFRGHNCLMLTSNGCQGGDGILNLLSINPFPHKSPEEYDLKDKVGWLLRSRRNYHVTKRVIEKFNPDVVYLHNLELVTLSPFTAAVDAGKRIVAHAHNEQYGLTYRALKNKEKESVISRAFKMRPGMERLRVIAISNYIASTLLKEGLSKERVHVIFNGLPREIMLSIGTGSPRDRKAIFVGSVSPHKGLHVAIEAISVLKRKGLRLPFEIIGKAGRDDYQTEMTYLTRRLDLKEEVIFVGPLRREEIFSRLKSSEVLLVPSLFEEPFGLVVAEAMAAGAIVVGSDRGAIPELVGEAGLISTPEAEPFAAAIERALGLTEDEKNRLRSIGILRVKALFNLERNISEIEKVLSLPA